MNVIVIASYAGALVLLYVCILLFCEGRKRNESLWSGLILVFGMIPGLVGVLFGFYLAWSPEYHKEGLAIVGAGLLLEFGALHLRRFGSFCSGKHGNPGSIAASRIYSRNA